MWRSVSVSACLRLSQTRLGVRGTASSEIDDALEHPRMSGVCVFVVFKGSVYPWMLYGVMSMEFVVLFG